MRRKLNDLMNDDFAVLVALRTGHHAISATDGEAEGETFVPALALLDPKQTLPKRILFQRTITAMIVPVTPAENGVAV